MIPKILICLLAVISCAGCTIIHLDGARHVNHVRLGILRIVPEDGVKLVSVQTRGIGIVPTSHGATLGYASENAVFQYDMSCSVVIFKLPEGERAREFWERAVTQDPNICLAEGER